MNYAESWRVANPPYVELAGSKPALREANPPDAGSSG